MLLPADILLNHLQYLTWFRMTALGFFREYDRAILTNFEDSASPGHQNQSLDRMFRTDGALEAVNEFVRHTGGMWEISSLQAEFDLDDHCQDGGTFREEGTLTMRMPEDRIFSDQEVSDILRRAVEISEREANAPYQPGVTRSELEHIAAEVGVSVEALHQAIGESGRRADKRGIFHLTEEFERVVEGELDPDSFDLVVEDLKSLKNGHQPAVSQVGRKLSMMAWTGLGQAKVDVTSRNGRTTLKVKSNALIAGLMTLHPGLMASLITMGAM